jgi:thioredoxin-related protein
MLAQSAPLPEICDVKIYRFVLPIALIAAFALAGSLRAENNWETDLKKAQEQAKANNKLVLLDFTGSDWCGYCMQLDREILSRPAFRDYANKNLVLVEIDFPRRKSQSVNLRKQNQQLAEEYRIQGFPTIIVLNGSGRKVWRYDGYFPGGPDAFIAELEKARKS